MKSSSRSSLIAVVIAASSICGVMACGGESASIERITILGCHKQEEPAPAIAACVDTNPDLVLWIGDNVYADTTDSPEYIRSCY